MPRSSRHKSSKHSSRDARDYSDSEKDSSSKDRKSRDESSSGKVYKESASGEKRKIDSKEGNGEYVDDYSTLKRRRERVDDGNDRWNGGDDDRGEGTKKSNDKLSESKSKRRDYGESDEVVKKSSGKSEGKHRESSSRKEGREEREKEKEKEKERFRRGKEGKTEKLIDVDDLPTMKQVSEKTESSARDLLQTSEMDGLSDRRSRKKRDDFSDGDKNHGEFGDSNDRRLSSREDVIRDGRPKEEKHKDDRYRDKYREDVERESRHRDDKLRDERVGKDHISNKSDFKNSGDDKDNLEIRPKKHKAQDGDRSRDRDNDRGSYQRERDRDRDRDRDHESDWDRDRDRDREREKEHDRDKNIDYDVLPTDDRNARYKDSRGRKRSPDDYDDYADTKSRGVKTAYLDMEKKSMNSRVESDADRGKSQSRQAQADNNAGSNRRRTSPNTSSPGAADEYRQLKQEDPKHKDTGIEHRSSKSISSRDVTGTTGPSERNSKYRSNEKHGKLDEGHMGELSIERTSSSKASPMGLVDRSPSSTSLERRYTSRAGVRRNLDIEESMRRSNAPMGSRDLPSADDRPSQDFPSEKSLMDDSTSVDSSFYNRTSQSNSTPIPPPSFRGRTGSRSPSYMDSLEAGRISGGSRYKRSGDPNIGRGQGNAWRGPPSWSSPLPNGFIPYQHGPHPGAFQAMLPQFPSPPLFGVRPPSMEISHSGIPYHISDADRFASHLRPLGWHGWDGNNGEFRDESHLYSGPEWDQSRHSVSGRGWDGNTDIWKGQNGDMNLDVPSTSLKDNIPVQLPVEKAEPEKAVDTKTSVAPLPNDSLKTSPKTSLKKTTDPPKALNGDNDRPYDAYLSQLDISAELADPELYTRFTSLLGVKQGASVDVDASMLVNLKDGARAIPKTSSILLGSSLFPVTSDSIFQRAMGIYKRQKASMGDLPFANDRIIDVILESKKDEEVVPNNETVPKEPVAKHNEEIPETNANVAAIKEAEVDAEVADLKLESFDEGLGHDIPDPVKPVMGPSETEIEGNTLNSEEEGEGKYGVLISPKTGSNESESVVLSRILHSPESTH